LGSREKFAGKEKEFAKRNATYRSICICVMAEKHGPAAPAVNAPPGTMLVNAQYVPMLRERLQRLAQTRRDECASISVSDI
jgi:hypothetical protein